LDDPIVSSDVAGNPASSIIDATFTRMLDYNKAGRAEIRRLLRRHWRFGN
jgi:hypothetical protein